jgi:hypothetical protein
MPGSFSDPGINDNQYKVSVTQFNMEVRMASLKCSKSDLAVVVHDHYEKNNLGLIVRIERYAGTRPIETFKPSNPFKPVGHRNMRCWQVRAVSKPGICVMDAEDKLYYVTTAAIPDCWLKPIRGEPPAEHKQSEEEQEERLDEELLSKELICQ